MTLITSRSNPKIKLIRSLRQRKYRLSHSLFIIEGLWHLGQALDAPAIEVDSLIYAPDLIGVDFADVLLEQATAQKIPCYPVSADVFQTLAEKENPQGILAVARIPSYQLQDLSPTQQPQLVALVSPQDPGNVGTILRTLDAVGGQGLLLLDHSTDPYHPNSVRASMGALFWWPVVQVTWIDFFNWATDMGYTLYGTSAHDAVDYREVTAYTRLRILLMGSERTGLTQEEKAACHHLLKLPMHGHASSLNLAVATSVLLYDMLAKT